MLLLLVSSSVSIHAPVMGATSGLLMRTWLTVGFNSRSRDGSDDSACASPENFDPVSIHAPVMGATERDEAEESSHKLFQFTLP